MRLYSNLLLLLMAVISFGCSINGDEQRDLECEENDFEVFIGMWSNPRFISSGNNCYLDECIEINLALNADFTYRLWYKVYEMQTSLILREINDQGNYILNCLEKGNLGGRLSALQYIKSELILNSDSLSQSQWILEWNGVEGFILQEEYLGFTHNAYIRLN